MFKPKAPSNGRLKNSSGGPIRTTDLRVMRTTTLSSGTSSLIHWCPNKCSVPVCLYRSSLWTGRIISSSTGRTTTRLRIVMIPHWICWRAHERGNFAFRAMILRFGISWWGGNSQPGLFHLDLLRCGRGYGSGEHAGADNLPEHQRQEHAFYRDHKFSQCEASGV